MRFLSRVRLPAPTAVAPPPPTVASVSAAPVPPQHAAAAAASPAPGFHSPLLRLWPHRANVARGDKAPRASAESARGEEAREHRRRKAEAVAEKSEEGREGNWVLQILRVQSRWTDDADAMAAGARGGDSAVPDAGEEDDGRERCVGCVSGGGDEEGCAVGEEEEVDRAAFSRLLRKVSLAEAEVYSKMSYLCNFAYMVPRIKVETREMRISLWGRS